MQAGTRAGLVAVAMGVLAGCGGSSSSSTPSTPGFYITISNMTFSPASLSVPPGGTVTVLNKDAVPHSVTSEATANAFTPGAVAGVSFDTGTFDGQKTFTIPASAPNGTRIPFYCTVHAATMKPPNGTITVDAAAQPAAPPGGSGGGGY
ncbi:MULTISPECIES: plastocyanin/azurin family copper-binding protein [unclassified Anaeromyxobacter]|uniref:plastocyanin/azurin family copper-binding protein n=1 Tax=unclassified Anaeromyxobacter TaxID=2620896 RepID=UPI001F591CDA|nr:MULTISPECIES: plastocyanin/azurin family copper-binding protein [unclassified Anaeromyxobacter]